MAGPIQSPDPHVGLAVHLLVCALLGAGLLAVAAAIRHRVRGPRPDKLATYECGEQPHGPAWQQAPVGFYRIALVFILFDAELAFIFLWVQSLKEVGPLAFWAMAAFLAVMLLGWVYAYRKNDLAWTR